MAEPDIQEIAQQFTQFYYNTFDGNRMNLAPLYRPESMLTFENQQIKGRDDIIEKLSALPFERVLHRVETLDAQPSTLPPSPGVAASGNRCGILVMATGALLVDEEERVMNYTQLFQLLPDEGNSYWVFNDVFRLIYPPS